MVTAAVVETYRRLFDIPVLLEQAETFASLCQVDAIWAVLQGQTMVRLARPLANRLGVPLYTQVWDPLSWWLTARRVDPWNRALALEAFDAAMRRSLASATASWPMAEEYSAKYGILSVPVISSHDPAMARHPHLEGGSGSVVTIGMAGQFYAAYEWNLLIKALNHAGWKVCGKDVRIITMGGGPPPCYYPPEGPVEFLGWKSQPEAIQILSEADILYCPYPFAPEMAEVVRLSFPSKLVLYLAAGRPVLFHGPAESSAARYLALRDAGVCCTAPEAATIYNELQRLVMAPELYCRVGVNGQKAFLSDFTLETMRRNFYAFLGLRDNQ